MKTYLTILSLFFAGIVTLAENGVPVVSDVSFSQSTDRTVTISYTLDEAAIVTIDVLTNNVSIGQSNISYLAGDVNRKVSSGNRTITWFPTKSWEGNKTDSAVIRVNAWALTAPPPYMAVSLTDVGADNVVRFYADADAVPGGVTNTLYKKDSLLLRCVPAKGVEWSMGSIAGELGRDDGSETNQSVTLLGDYYIGVYEVTQLQYRHLMNASSSYYFSSSPTNQYRPVDNLTYAVRWDAAPTAQTAYPVAPQPTSFLGKLRTQTGVAFDLPSEAQWEFACRAGHYGPVWNNGEAIVGTDWDIALHYRLGRYIMNGGKLNPIADPGTGSSGSLHPQASSTDFATAAVGSYQPNALGLYDMHGNVAELCQDWYEAKYVYPNHDGAVNKNSASGTLVMRGGSYYRYPSWCRSATRREVWSGSGITVGFRLMAPANVFLQQ